ncbi:hypothetical protein MRS44_001110 [Fusarium solani]|uniref:uncharacterized protein n=1 Tax=Fusarium solani TaxID=169388 RepID=UPI0032C3F2AE|nr:hypothetical protein MRS44_001110 [Fusarium solani]
MDELDPPSISEISPNIFVGNVASSLNRNVLRHHNITAIVSLLDGGYAKWNSPRNRQIVPQECHLFVPCLDNSTMDILTLLDEICAFIDLQLGHQSRPRSPSSLLSEDLDFDSTPSTPSEAPTKGPNILIHCRLGMSRSASVAIAYLMRRRGESLDVILPEVRTRRKVKPRDNFMDQLRHRASPVLSCTPPPGNLPTLMSTHVRSPLRHLVDMGREDQIEEREVLESIFPDEITDISETEFRVSIALDIPDEEDEEPPTMLLQVRYPDEYPEKPPHLDILAPPNATPHEHFNVADDRDQLLSSLEETIQENLGMAMIFTLVSMLKETAEQLVQDRKAAVEKAHEEALLAAEAEENKKFHGTTVTPETFLKWREGFLKEMEERRQREEDERLQELKKAKVKEPARLTGKQLWERGLVGKGEGEEEDDDIPVEAVEKLKVEA